MIAETTKSIQAARSSASKPLRRGRACMNCRFLKIKCDGMKPICGPCIKHPKDDECEYSDGPGRSRTKQLEDTVSRLEARLHELEHPHESTPSVTLHDPYRLYHDSQPFTTSPIESSPESLPFSPLSPFSPTSTASSLPSGRHWNNFSALSAMTESTGSSTSSTSPQTQRPTSPTFLGREEPAFPIIQNLLDLFLPHAAAFGFFLSVSRFYNNALQPLSFGHQSRPTPALLSVVYLWGVHLSRSEPFLSHEYVFLTRALQHTATDLLGSHPDKILHTIQAEVLLSYYFLRTGKFLEAKSHTGSAISLTLGCGLHKIRSSNLLPPSTIGLVGDTPMSLHPPNNNVDEGERINGFWTVFTLHKLISVTLESPSNVCGALEAPGMQIDTPWPCDIETYKDDSMGPDVRGNSTVRNFLLNWPVAGQDGTSTTARCVQAAILCHRAAHLTGQWTPNMQTRETQAFGTAFQAINRLIDTFRANLPQLTQLDLTQPSTRTMLLAHALTDAATIKLHSIFAYANPSSKQVCLSAAQNMVKFGGVNLQEVGYLNPVMGTLWMSACHVFIDEISRVRSPHNLWSPSGFESSEEELMEGLRTGITALSLFSDDSTLMKHQLTKIQEAFSAI